MRKRHKHTLSHYRMVTARLGQLFPVCCVPVLPGDTIQGHTSALVRVSPLNTPVMHPVTIRMHSWFVPNRVVWPETDPDFGWENFITGGNSGDNPATVPQMANVQQERALTSYLGAAPAEGASINALPVRAANLIFNERYRDQDLVPRREEEDWSSMQCAWEKDYFTTSRPWTQRGSEITLPLGDKAPVMHASEGGQSQVTVRQGADGNDWVRLLGTPNVTTGVGDQDEADRLYADLAAAQQININDFRTGFALQRYQEARARYGARFVEYLRYLGIKPSDARLQEPEYLTGSTARLQFSEVLQTTPSETPGENGVGDLYGHGIAGARTGRYRKFFEEHGFIITMMSVRPKAIYTTAQHREWLKQTKEDYFQRELANLGQQEVYTRELYNETDGTAPENEVFSFQDRYDEYRTHPSQVSQDFRGVLNAWHLAREFDQEPVLNESFVECNPSDRIFQVATNDTLWIMVNNHIVARRLVPKRANPRVL